MRVASGVVVAAEKVEILPFGAGGEESRVESLLGDAVAALEREEGEEKFHFQMVDLGEVPPIFVSRQGWRWFVCRSRLR